MIKQSKENLYLQKLDDARCEDDWDAIPEAVRKVRKHSPNRQCLAITAETEHAITRAQLKQAPGGRPSTAVSTKDIEISGLVPKLLSAIEEEKVHPEDKYQAQVCLGWLHWVVGEYDLAASRLPQGLGQETNPAGLSEWTRVCMLKSAYLRANCMSRNSRKAEALTIFESALPSLSAVWSGQTGGAQLQFWAELFLTEYCMLQAQALERGEARLEDINSLAAFRSWARYFEAVRIPGSALAGGYGFRGAVPRRRVWSEYYTAVSSILEQDLAYPTGYSTVNNDTSARNQLRTELKQVEVAYEALLLAETTFPRADEERAEVESFVELVMRNWEILNGRDWHGNDLGSGGKEGLSRGVLDILYRAAQKTFHSTAILRHLFGVHLAIAEFDLAFKAFDSYLEIVQKGKTRVDKTGVPEASLDDDATVLETMATAITALCKYGSQEEAERARDLGVELEEMLNALPPPIPHSDNSVPEVDEENVNGAVLHPRLSPRVNAIAWRAIGLSQAQWSRKMYHAAARTEMKMKAIRSFQESLSPDTGNPNDIRTLFTLGLLLAEQRELPAAIDVVKAALMSSKMSAEQDVYPGSYWRERSLIPLWHLLALLLSARQDFVMAARACEGAFEQFDDPTVLFGTQDLQGPYRSEHLNEAEANNEKMQGGGLVDEMDDLEKEGIMEVKMTQLTLLEVLEGPEVAVNASHELLALYTRLFGIPSGPLKAPAAARKPTTAVPKSSAGTLRSLRGSIFGRRSEKGTRPPLPRPATADATEDEKTPTSPARPKTTQSAMVSPLSTAPTIKIIKDNGEVGDHRDSRSLKSRQSTRANRSRSLRKREPSARGRRSLSSSGVAHRPSISDGEAYFTPFGEGVANAKADYFTLGGKGLSGRRSSSKTRGLLRLDSVDGSGASGAPSDTLTSDSLSSPNPLPVIQFPKDQVTRRRQAVLIRVWLMIGAFYRRAKMFRDCQGAIDEAKKLADALEADTNKDGAASAAIRKSNWGGKKGVEELWSDVRSEMGYLSLAEDAPFTARGNFEEALMHFPDHPSAIVGLSNILLDLYSEALPPDPAIPSITLPNGEPANVNTSPDAQKARRKTSIVPLPSTPLGLGGGERVDATITQYTNGVLHQPARPPKPATSNELTAPYKATSLPLIDRLAARDRAYGLLSSLTKLGTGWNYTDAWFALARAYEESGQPEKAKEALWWCVELEEGMGVRGWSCVGSGSYVL